MAASMDGMFRLFIRFRRRLMPKDVVTLYAVMNFQRRMAMVTKYQTKGDETIAELKTFRNHPGIMRPKQVRLPKVFRQNINKYLADKPVNRLKPHATTLGNYLWKRSRPLEESDLRDKAQGYAVLQGVENIDEEMLRSKELSKDNKKKVASVVKHLRRHVYHWQPITYDETTACTYVMSRIAPNYGITYRVLHEIKKRVPDFSPQALLDFGSGTGTATWAAHSLWGDTIQEFYCVDTSRAMHNVAEALMEDEVTKDEQNTPLKRVYFRHFLPMSLQKKYDLTVSAFSLLELPSKADRLNTLRTLWHKTEQFLVLIECGTNEGYKTILEARDFILNGVANGGKKPQMHSGSPDKDVTQDMAKGEPELTQDPVTVTGHVFAPCQHDLPCPRLTDASNTPCNFEQDFHDYTKRGHTSEVTRERFCYLVLKKGPRVSGDATRHWPRLVRPVLTRSRHVVCRLCCSDGQLQETVITRAKHSRELYRCSRYSKWGDLLPVSEPRDDGVVGGEHDSDGEHSGSDC